LTKEDWQKMLILISQERLPSRYFQSRRLEKFSNTSSTKIRIGIIFSTSAKKLHHLLMLIENEIENENVYKSMKLRHYFENVTTSLLSKLSRACSILWRVLNSNTI